jgi:hypothetical protein
MQGKPIKIYNKGLLVVKNINWKKILLLDSVGRVFELDARVTEFESRESGKNI